MTMTEDLLSTYALSFLGTIYRYGAAPGGGDDPITGFDCSGLVCELLRAAGVVPWNFRTNAQGLYDLLMDKQPPGLAKPGFGSLAFYGKSKTEISHVGFCLTAITMIEAGGGDHTTLTPETAAKQNAFVRLRPIKFRRDFLTIVHVDYSGSLAIAQP